MQRVLEVKLAWCTDLHLDCVDGPDEDGRVEDEFATPLSQCDDDAVLITGDVSTGQNVVRHLKIIEKILKKRVFFVCGNHDFWDNDFESVRLQLKQLCGEIENLRYLTASGVTMLSEKTALVGHDGWYDAYYGDFRNNMIVMQDWYRIHDYRNACGPALSVGPILGISRRASRESSEHFRANLEEAAKRASVVVAATHVPPWAHDIGTYKPSPWYTSKLAGDAFEETAKKHPDVRFEVFCGHTHVKADFRVARNLFCHVGRSEYGKPSVVSRIVVQ